MVKVTEAQMLGLSLCAGEHQEPSAQACVYCKVVPRGATLHVLLLYLVLNLSELCCPLCVSQFVHIHNPVFELEESLI